MTRLQTIVTALSLSCAAWSCAEDPSDEAVVEATPIMNSELAPAAQSKAELAELISTMVPQKARDGSFRFSDARLLTPTAAALLVDRLQSGRETTEVSIALALALPGTQGQYAQAVLDLLSKTKDESLRAALVDSLRLSTESALALDGLRLAMEDSSAVVRSRAAFNIGRRVDGKAIAGTLLKGLADADADVQSQSARALGHLRIKDAFDGLLPLLASADATLRLESLRAMARVDGDRAATLPQLKALSTDSDERVRTAAEKVAAHGYSAQR